MAETQDALVHNVEKLTELVATQSLRMIAQSKAMDAQSVKDGAGREADGAPRGKRRCPAPETPVETASA